MSTLGKYILVQLPSVLLVTVILLLLRHWWGLPGWLVWSLLALWIAKDAALFPLVRRAYEPADSGTSGALLGKPGMVRKTLDPVGYIEVRGELWRAELIGGGSLGRGERVWVREVHGLTLRVEPESPDREPYPEDGT